MDVTETEMSNRFAEKLTRGESVLLFVCHVCFWQKNRRNLRNISEMSLDNVRVYYARQNRTLRGFMSTHRVMILTWVTSMVVNDNLALAHEAETLSAKALQSRTYILTQRIYTHVTTKGLNAISSPLDEMDI